MASVSVIVPVYNVEKYIRKCLKSLVNQTLQDIEIIIIDDGSTDYSADIIKEFQKKYGNIRYYKKENGGLSDARNYGLQYVTAKYVAFLDSDDFVEPDLYKRMYEKAKKHDSDMVECDFYWTYGMRNKKDIGVKYSDKYEMLEKARVVAWNKLYKKELLRKANIQFPKGLRYEDVEFFYKLVPYINNVSFVKKPLIHYVQRKESIISTQNEKTRDIFKVLDNVINYYKEKKLYDEYRDVLEYTYTRILLCSSFRRMCKIKNGTARRKLLNENWITLNTKFPNWKENRILNTNLNKKKRYMKSVNRLTYKIYAFIYKIF